MTTLAPTPTRSAPLLALLAVVVVFVALAGFIAAKTPAWEANDEPGHVQNVETLLNGHWYAIPPHCTLDPTVGPLFNCAGSEPQQPPLYYLLAAGWQTVLDLPIQQPYRGSPNGALVFGLHHASLANDHTANHGFVIWLRALSILLGALTLLVTFLATRLVTADRWTPVVAAAVLAFLPRFVFLAPFVTNDILVAFLGAVLMYVSLRFALKPSWWRMALVGAVYGLLVLTKLSALPLGLVIVVAALLVAGWTRRAGFFALGIASALVVSSWYLVQNIVRYGDPLAFSATKKYQTTIDGLGNLGSRPYVIHDPLRYVFVKVPAQLVHSLWFQSGWGQFNWPSWLNWTITVGVVALIATLLWSRPDRRVLAVLGTLVVGGLLGVWLSSLSTGTFAGRYAVGGAAALAALVGLAVEQWRLPVRFIVPALGFIGTLVAIQTDVLAVKWT